MAARHRLLEVIEDDDTSVMHTSEELASSTFDIRVDGRPGTIADVFPGFDARDRVGVVVREALGGQGASTLVLAAVTAFYDVHRARGRPFFIYPDYFTFMVGGVPDVHRWFDIHPPHKHVAVADRTEDVLTALNDRAITRLVVPEGPAGGSRPARESAASARERMRTAIAYSPGGRVADADIEIAGDEHTERYVRQNIDECAALSAGPKARIAGRRAMLQRDGRPVETFHRLTLDEAIARLAG